MGSKLTLGVGGWRLHGQRTGVARYLLSLVENFTPELIRGCFAGVNLYVPRALESGIHLPSSVNVRMLPSRLPMLAWENFRLAATARDDVVFYPSFARPFVTGGATVVTTHEAIMKIAPQMFDKRARFIYGPLYGWSARAATLVITTSNAAKRDIAAAWDVDPAKIRVTPLAAAPVFEPLPASVDRAAMRAGMFGDDSPYFLFVGKISGRRNVPELVRGFLAFKRRTGLRYRLVIAGPDYATQAVRRIAAELGAATDVVTRPYVLDDALNEMYNCAEAFVMPSVYENGSLPVMEAQAAGTPVISVDTEGTRETTGGAALLLPHMDADALADAMTRVAGDSPLRSDLSARGLANSSQYSWARCAKETLTVCEEAARVYRG